MQVKPTKLLQELEGIHARFGDAQTTRRKVVVLEALSRQRLRTATAVLRLHEALCFLRAYPDNKAVLHQVESMLRRFASRADLQQHAAALENSGIAGTAITYPFFWPMARWLAQEHPDHLHLDWQAMDHTHRLADWLPQLVLPAEGGALDELEFTVREWIDRLRGAQVTDATFIVRRIAGLQASASIQEAVHDQFDLQYRLEAGPDTASRTRAHHKLPVTYQRGELHRQRPALPEAIFEQPRKVRLCSERQGRQLVDLAREAMLTRSRDLDVFSYGNPRDVRLVDFGDGLQFACIGFVPERRLLLHSLYGFLTLKNGVPIGYVLASALFGCAGIAYNTFETYRGAEAGFVFGRVLAMAHLLFGARSFSIDPYQLGYGNSEGLASGAWWFYYKLGFRPLDADVKRTLRGELRKMKSNRQHRSSVKTLEKLASADVYYHLDAAQWGKPLPPMEAVSLALSRTLTRTAGADRQAGLQECAARAQELLGVRTWSGWSRTEKRAWLQWAPLVCCLRGLRRWDASDKKGVLQVIRAKGGRRESDFVRLFESHRKLRAAVLRLGIAEWEAL